MTKLYNRLKALTAAATLLAASLGSSYAQQSSLFTGSGLTLEMAIEIAKGSSSQAKVAQFTLLGKYWNFRSYKANMLPSLELNADVMNYDRSLVEDRVGTEIVYVDNNTLENVAELAIVQNIAATGGKLSFSSDITRLDQFDNESTPLLYKTNPMSINYSQPLLAFNSLKWKKKTEPKKYEQSKRVYLESMEEITIKTTTYYFNVLSTESQYKRYLASYDTRKKLYETAKKRYELGTIKYNDLLQLQLSVLNDEMSINTTRINLESNIFTLCSYIGLTSYKNVELVQPDLIPDLSLDFGSVLDKAYANSSHSITQDLKQLTSEQEVAKAKGANGLQADLSVKLGLSQKDEELPKAYQDLQDREIVGLSLSLPLFDWGVGKGEVKMALADLDVTLTEMEEDDREFRQDIYTKVMEFNNQKRQCEISTVAQSIARERLEITTLRYQNGTVSVTDLDNAQDDFNEAQTDYIKNLKEYWSCYYEVQKLTLYDYKSSEDITAEFDKLVE